MRDTIGLYIKAGVLLAGIVASYTLLRAEVVSVQADITRIDKHGTVAMRQYIDEQMRLLTRIEIQIARIEERLRRVDERVSGEYSELQGRKGGRN